jgi:hypothetical protein
MRPLFAVAAALVSTAAFAQAPGSPNRAAISGGTYAADPGHSLVVWTLDHMGFSPYTGIFGDVTGSLTIDPKNPVAARVDVTIPVAKVTTASAGLTEQDKGFVVDENRTALSFAPSAKWGLTLNVRDADRLAAAPKDEASFGAFYNVSPRFRVGGQLSVAGQPLSVRSPTLPVDQASAGVKLESAFRF